MIAVVLKDGFCACECVISENAPQIPSSSSGSVPWAFRKQEWLNVVIVPELAGEKKNSMFQRKYLFGRRTNCSVLPSLK